jgi:hypothetical protein
MKSKFVLGGDFNAKHPAFGCTTSNPRGIALFQVLQGLQVNVLNPLEPTRFLDGLPPEILDFFVVKQVIEIIPQVIHDLSSNHYPVLLKVTQSDQQTPP